MTNKLDIPDGVVANAKTTQQLQVEGDIKIRMFVLYIIGGALLIIIFGSMCGLILNEATFGKYWQGLQAIISGAIFGLVGFIAGRSSLGRSE